MRPPLTPSTDRGISSGRFVAFAIAGFFLASLTACNSPNTTDISLIKDKQALEARVADLNRQHQADQASLAAANKAGVEMLSAGRLDTLFTAVQLKIADRTGGDRSVTDLPYDDRLKVSAVPIDMYGDAIKASGSFHVTAFDLDDPADPTIGQWDFPLSDAEKNWFGKLFLYNYILECPWQKVPRHGELTIKVVFLDALTQRELEAQTIIHVTPPPPNSVATISPTTKP